MLSTPEKILLLDEVTNTARASWQIIVIGDNDFRDCPRGGPYEMAYLGYHTVKNLLSVSLMSACYSLVDTGKRSYSFHHAEHDASLKISTKTKAHFERCFEYRGRIATYRNNVVAHVNNRRSQSDWADFAGIKHQDIDTFLDNALAAVLELARDNSVSERALGVTKPVRSYFHEFCRITAKIENNRQMADKK